MLFFDIISLPIVPLHLLSGDVSVYKLQPFLKYINCSDYIFKDSEPLTEDLPVCKLVYSVKQKRHLWWQCVMVPRRSPDVSVHADKCGIMRGNEEGGEKKMCTGLDNKGFSFRVKKLQDHQILLAVSYF